MTEAKSLSAAAAAALPTPAQTAARCACGHAMNHPQVLPEPVYNTRSWFMFLIGVTAEPRAVLYRCLWCKQVLGRTRDPKVLSRFD